MKPMDLTPGTESKTSSSEMKRRQKEIIITVEHYLPGFVEAVKTHAMKEVEEIWLHQDAFAADYDRDELILLGAAVKYAGMRGMGIRLLGTNRETMT